MESRKFYLFELFFFFNFYEEDKLESFCLFVLMISDRERKKSKKLLDFYKKIWYILNKIKVKLTARFIYLKKG